MTIAAPPSTPATVVLVVGRAARRAGAQELELGLARPIARRAPAGEVQALVFGRGPVLRLEVVPLSLRLFSTPVPGAPPRDHPRGMGYDPRSAANDLTLHLGTADFRISSREGVLGPLPRGRLRETLRTLHAAYPDDAALALVPAQGTSLGDLLATAATLHLDRDRPFFTGLALASPGLATPPEADLGPLLRLLSRATVTLEPTSREATVIPLLRRCYLTTLRDFIDHPSPPRGTLQIPAGRRPGGTLRHAATRRCVAGAIATLPRQEGTLTARFELADLPAAPDGAE